jgi:hypothetical protein
LVNLNVKSKPTAADIAATTKVESQNLKKQLQARNRVITVEIQQLELRLENTVNRYTLATKIIATFQKMDMSSVKLEAEDKLWYTGMLATWQGRIATCGLPHQHFLKNKIALLKQELSLNAKAILKL